MLDIPSLDFLGISILIVIIRIWPILYPGMFESSDSWFHFWRTVEIERNHLKIPKVNKQFILKGRTCYPPLLHYLILLFPAPNRHRWAHLISPIADLLAVLFFIVLYTKELWILSPNDLFLAISVYFLSPMLLQFHATPIYSVKARNLGRFFLIGSLVFLHLYETTSNWSFLLLSSLFFGLILITSKFALQAYLFIVFVFIFVYPEILIVMTTGFLLALIISRGFVIHVLKEHIAHQKMYFRKMKYYTTASVINNLEDIYFIFNIKNIFKKPLSYAKHVFYNITFTRIIFLMPDYFICLFLLCGGHLDGKRLFQADNYFLIVWLLACSLAFIITSFKAFVSLGQSYRYLEYALFPGTLLLVQIEFFNRFQSIWHLIVFYLGFYLLSNAKIAYRCRKRITDNRIQNQQIHRLRDKISRMQNRRVLCVPMKMALLLADIHKHQYFWASPFTEPTVKPSFWDETFRAKMFPFPKSIIDIYRKYHIDTIILDRNYFEDYQKELKQLEAICAHEYGNYLVYEISDDKAVTV